MVMREKIEEIFYKVNNNETYRNAFYKKLSTTNNTFPWLYEIKEKELFYPLKKEHYFGCLNYLENYSKQITNTTDEVYVLDLLELLKMYIENPVVIDKNIKKYYIDYMIIKIIFNLPKKYLEAYFINFIEHALRNNSDKILISGELEKNVIPKLILNKNKELLLNLIEVIADPVIIDSVGFSELQPLMDDFWFAKIITDKRNDIIDICGPDLYPVLFKKIQTSLDQDNRRYNLVSVPSIEYSDQIQRPDKYEYLMVSLLRDIILQKCRDFIESITNDLLKQEYAIFTRIAIHILDVLYEKNGNLFWSIDKNLILDPNLKHELYVFFQNNSPNFNETQIDKIISWIKEFEHKVIDLYNNEKERELASPIAYELKEWFFSLISSKNEKIIAEYEKNNRINPTPLEHPGWSIWSSGVVSIGPPETVTFDFSSLSDDQVLCELNEKKFTGSPIDDWYDNEVLGGFKKEIRKNYTRYLANPQVFSELRIEYQNALFSELLDFLNKNQLIDVELFIKYVETLHSSNSFWSQSVSYLSPNIVNRKITDILTYILRDESEDIADSIFNRIEAILLHLSNSTESDLPKLSGKIDSVLNSTLGNIYSSMMIYSLRRAKLFSEKNNKWSPNIEQHFTELLLQKSRTVEYQVTLGQFLPNIFYLNREWVEQNLEHIFTLEPDQIQTCFSAYLYYSTSLYSELYLLLLSKDYYELSLSWEYEKSIFYDRIVQHACVSYLNEIEDESEAFLNKIISGSNEKYLSSLVFFIWRSREYISKKMKEKVIRIWENLYELLNEPTKSVTHRSVISRLSYWLILVDEIDEKIVEMTQFSASMLETGEEMFLIEYLLHHVQKYPKEVSEIMLEMMDNGFIPRHKQDDIVSLLIEIFKHGQYENGLSISNIFLLNSIDFVKSVLQKYKQ